MKRRSLLAAVAALFGFGSLGKAAPKTGDGVLREVNGLMCIGTMRVVKMSSDGQTVTVCLYRCWGTHGQAGVARRQQGTDTCYRCGEPLPVSDTPSRFTNMPSPQTSQPSISG